MTGSFFSLGFRAEFYFQGLCFLSLLLPPLPPEATSQMRAGRACVPAKGLGNLGPLLLCLEGKI